MRKPSCRPLRPAPIGTEPSSLWRRITTREMVGWQWGLLMDLFAFSRRYNSALIIFIFPGGMSRLAIWREASKRVSCAWQHLPSREQHRKQHSSIKRGAGQSSTIACSQSKSVKGDRQSHYCPASTSQLSLKWTAPSLSKRSAQSNCSPLSTVLTYGTPMAEVSTEKASSRDRRIYRPEG